MVSRSLIKEQHKGSKLHTIQRKLGFREWKQVPGVQRQPGLQSKLQASLGYTKEGSGEKRKEREEES